MIAQSIGKYCWFGTCLRYLQDAPTTHPLRAPDQGGILDNIDRFLQYLDELGLVVTQRASSSLKTIAGKLQSQPPESKLSTEQALSLMVAMNDLRKTLEAEIQGFEAFVVTPKRLDVRKLLDDVPGLMAPGVFATLPSIAQIDFREACTCIAFERSTAAAFHLLRGAESVLRSFYCRLVKQKRVDLMWGPMLTDLRKRRKSRHYSVLLDNLDNIRRSFRNPTQHPEMTYTINEVQDLFGLCVDVVNRMSAVLTANGS